MILTALRWCRLEFKTMEIYLLITSYMKTTYSKLLLTAALAVAAMSFAPVSADAAGRRTDYSRDDVYYGAHKGGFALSFGAAPVLNFVGNMFNGTDSQNFDGLGGLNSVYYDGVTMSGKYFLRDNWALTAQFGFNCQGIGRYTYDDAKATNPSTIKNSGTNSFLAIVGAQYLMRPGKRLQPVLGVGAMYAYANKNYSRQKSTGRSDSVSESPTNALGIVANVGVEFFVWKAISLSATVDLGLNGSWTKEKTTSSDTNYNRQSASSVNFVTGRVGGNLALNFYF